MYRKLHLELILILSCITFNTTAQNYQCIPDNNVHFFINSDYYLRAIRLDSVNTINGNKVQYPFKTARGPHDAQKQEFVMHKSGNWLGNTITIQPDGTHFFENHAGDMLMIKTQAVLNDTWELFRATSSYVFEATVTSVDTMTILNGVIDSVKVITITVMDSGNVDHTNYYNGKEIIVSKGYGFVQAYNFFLIDYDERDFYKEKSREGSFKLVDFKSPNENDIYDFSPGEVFQYEDMGFRSKDGSPEIVTDSIISRMKKPNNVVSYTILRSTITRLELNSKQGITPDVDTFILTVNNDNLLDLSKLPEEWGSNKIIYYNPRDSAFCRTGKSYGDIIAGVTYTGVTTAYANTFEACYWPNYRFMEGMGELNKSGCVNGSGDPRSHIMQYARKDNIPCGKYATVKKLDNEKQYDVSIYPNPAVNVVYFKLANQAKQHFPVTLALTNMSGSIIDEQTIYATSTELDITSYPTGVYMLRFTYADGAVLNRKLTVVH